MSPSLPSEAPLVYVHRELTQALAEAPGEVKGAMAIDPVRSIGCHACAVACVSQYKLPPGGGLSVC